MNLIGTELKDVLLIDADRFEDERGYFMPYFIKNNLKFANVDFDVKQCNRSKSAKGVLRGLHFQTGEDAQAKIVEVVSGAVLDIVLDLRKDSPTYMQHRGFFLSEKDNLLLYIPRGFAHGFLAIEDNTIFQYLVDNDYRPEAEDGILIDDPALGIDWQDMKKAYGIEEYIINEKDRKYIPLKDRTIDF